MLLKLLVSCGFSSWGTKMVHHSSSGFVQSVKPVQSDQATLSSPSGLFNPYIFAQARNDFVPFGESLQC